MSKDLTGLINKKKSLNSIMNIVASLKNVSLAKYNKLLQNKTIFTDQCYQRLQCLLYELLCRLLKNNFKQHRLSLTNFSIQAQFDNQDTSSFDFVPKNTQIHLMIVGFDIGFTGSFLAQMMTKIQERTDLSPNNISAITFVGKKTQNCFMSSIKSYPEWLTRVQEIPNHSYDTFSKKILQNQDVAHFIQRTTELCLSSEHFVVVRPHFYKISSYDVCIENLIEPLSQKTVAQYPFFEEFSENYNGMTGVYDFYHDILEHSLPSTLEQMIKYRILSFLNESFLVENSIRFINMDGALTNTEDFIKKTGLMINKGRQEKITNQILETAVCVV